MLELHLWVAIYRIDLMWLLEYDSKHHIFSVTGWRWIVHLRFSLLLPEIWSLIWNRYGYLCECECIFWSSFISQFENWLCIWLSLNFNEFRGVDIVGWYFRVVGWCMHTTYWFLCVLDRIHHFPLVWVGGKIKEDGIRSHRMIIIIQSEMVIDPKDAIACLLFHGKWAKGNLTLFWPRLPQESKLSWAWRGLSSFDSGFQG